jgi:hypothetical protein
MKNCYKTGEGSTTQEFNFEADEEIQRDQFCDRQAVKWKAGVIWGDLAYV